MWRWSQLEVLFVHSRFVFSTYVEVIPIPIFRHDTVLSFLHVCGGDPSVEITSAESQKFSPRMWRWSQEWLMVQRRWWCFLHVCGGDPTCVPTDSSKNKFSPRMWRWSSRVVPSAWFTAVFSTYVEVILAVAVLLRFIMSFLHVCGGDPYLRLAW